MEPSNIVDVVLSLTFALTWTVEENCINGIYKTENGCQKRKLLRTTNPGVICIRFCHVLLFIVHCSLYYACTTLGGIANDSLTIFVQSFKMETVTKGFDARLANRPFIVFDFWALWRSGLNTRRRIPEPKRSYFGITKLKGVNPTVCYCV